jgi:hypothetical protein
MAAFLFSCDYATCAVPEAYREVFRGNEDAVESAEGWEPGALNLAQGFAMKLRTPLVHGDVTRLLIDFGQDGPARWSRFSGKLPEGTLAKLADRHERPYRASLRGRIAEDLRRHAAVVHVAVHTDAVTDGQVTLETPPDSDLAEKGARSWRNKLAAADVDVRHICNCARTPLAVALASENPADKYAQIRLAVSQTFFLEGRPWRWETLKKLLLSSVTEVAAELSAAENAV